MADFNALEALINANIKKNGVQAITGNILNGILRGMVSALGKGYTIAGSVTPSSDPGTMTGPVAYIAYTAGTYTHFDGLEVEQGEVAMLIYNEAEWHKEVLYSLAATATVDGNVGTPEVGVSFVDGLLTFNFRNMKGEPGVNGQDGEAAGFGAVTASVDASVGTPSVTVSSSGPNTAKSFAFSFHNLKGEQGVQGIQGIQGPQGVQGEQGIQGPVGVESCVVTVDNTSGTPSCSVSLVGQVLHLDFTGLKGAQGDTGSSVDYPFTIVNNLTTNDATQALSAAMGVQLESEVSQLEAKADELDEDVNGTPHQFVPTWQRPDYYLSTRGVPTSLSGWNISAPLTLKKGQTITVETQGAGFCVIAQTDANGESYTPLVTVEAASGLNSYSYKATEQKIIAISVKWGTGDATVQTSQDGLRQRQEDIEAKLNDKTNRIVKSKDDFAKVANAYVYWPSNTNGWTQNNNYELYIIRAEGVKAFYGKNYDTGTAELFIGFFSNAELSPSSLITESSIRSKNGEKESFITDIPQNAKYIVYCNRSASGTGEFRVYYDSMPDEIQGERLFIDELLNSDTSNGNIKSSSGYDYRRIVTKSICSFKRQGCTIYFRAVAGISCYFWYSTTSSSSSITETTNILKDGDHFVFPVTATHFRIVFRQINNTDINAEDVTRLINAGEIFFYYDFKEKDVIDRNLALSVYVGAAKRNLTGLLDGMDSMFVMSHISDVHGDSERFKNFAKYSDASDVDAAFNSGDAVMYRGIDRNTFAKNIMADYPTLPYLYCIGNHEVNELQGLNLFTEMMSPLVTPYGYLKASDTPADDCYYYKDFSEKRIRVIVLNYYNGGIFTGSLGQTQITWFINTLTSTPSGFGVVVMLHSQEDTTVAPEQYETFYQKVRYTSGSRGDTHIGNRPIMQIVDAFIGRTAISTSYTDNGTTVNISADFSGIEDDTIEFIAYVVGHLHEDSIGYYEHATNKQLSLGITAGVALYGHGSNAAFANQEDLPRGGIGTCQDAFNIYAIDRVHKTVKVVRIGANMTFNFQPREYMEIPYEDTQN